MRAGLLGLVVATLCARTAVARAAAPSEPASISPTADLFVSPSGNDDFGDATQSHAK